VSQATKNIVFLSIKTGIPFSVLVKEEDVVIDTYFKCLEEIHEAEKEASRR
jgi:hypothetical protein